MRDRNGALAFGSCVIGAALFVLASAAGAQADCNVRGQFLLSSEGPWNMFLDTDAGNPAAVCSAASAPSSTIVFICRRLRSMARSRCAMAVTSIILPRPPVAVRTALC